MRLRMLLASFPGDLSRLETHRESSEALETDLSLQRATFPVPLHACPSMHAPPCVPLHPGLRPSMQRRQAGRTRQGTTPQLASCRGRQQRRGGRLSSCTPRPPGRHWPRGAQRGEVHRGSEDASLDSTQWVLPPVGRELGGREGGDNRKKLNCLRKFMIIDITNTVS